MRFPWTGRIIRAGSALRATANKDVRRPYAGVLADLPQGTRVTVVAQEGNWLRVALSINGKSQTGYVSEELIAPAPPGDESECYQFVLQGNVIAVVKVPCGRGRGPRGDFLTEEQLQSTLQRNSIPLFTASSLSGQLSSLHFIPGFEQQSVAAFSRPLENQPIRQSNWRGTLGEVAARYQRPIPQQDLNALQPNFPIFDLRRDGTPTSVKTSVRSSSLGGDAYGTYLRGLADILGLRAQAFASAGELLHPGLSPAEAQARMLRDGRIAVNQDHFEPFRAALRNPDNYRRTAYLQLANRLLSLAPVRIHGATYSDYQALERLQRDARTSSAVRQQIQTALRNVREQLASRVIDNGLKTQHLRDLQSFRRLVARNNPTMTQAQLEAWLFPELLLAARYGGGLRGNMRATAAAGARSAGGGAMVSVVVQRGLFLWESPPDMGPQLLKVGIAGPAR